VQFHAALQLADGDTEKARAHAMIGGAWLAKGNTERAVAECEQALALDPALPEARANLALARLRGGDPAAAARGLQEALDAGADQPEVQLGLADALAHLDRDEEAAAHYRAALAARPGWADAANNFAWLLAHSADPNVRDPAEALRQAEVAASATERRDPNVLDTLAAAQEAAGQPEAAAATLDEAVARATEAGDGEAVRSLRAHRRALGRSPPD
jgi:Tfp pilus assembly protein PilF